MTVHSRWTIAAICMVSMGVAGCGDGGPFGRSSNVGVSEAVLEQRQNTPMFEVDETPMGIEQRGGLFDLFSTADNPNVTVEVNRYIWNAALDILDFMPIESVDPFSGVIVYGFGTPPGSSRAYRATVFVRDPALDARSLNVALVARSGPASTETVRAIEDAILTRARQLRVRDGSL